MVQIKPNPQIVRPRPKTTTARSAAMRRSKAAQYRAAVSTIGKVAGNTVWLVCLCILLCLDFAYGFLLGLGLGIRSLRSAVAAEHDRKDAEARQAAHQTQDPGPAQRPGDQTTLPMPEPTKTEQNPRHKPNRSVIIHLPRGKI